jgi:hypothetical protein
MRSLSALGALFAFATTAWADPRVCAAQIEFSVQDRSVLAQELTLEFGEATNLVIDKPDQTGAWQLRITADAPTLIRRVTTIPIDIEIYEITAGQSYLRASPHVGAVPGQLADLEMIFGNDDGRKARIRVVANVVARSEVPAIDDPKVEQP